MRREHASILTEVLDAVASCSEERPGDLHITAVAARANLPHDRLKGYLAELTQAGLLRAGWPASLTPRGGQFLECYHAWLRLQASFGLRRAPAPFAAPPLGQRRPATPAQLAPWPRPGPVTEVVLAQRASVPVVAAPPPVVADVAVVAATPSE